MGYTKKKLDTGLWDIIFLVRNDTNTIISKQIEIREHGIRGPANSLGSEPFPSLSVS